MYLQSDASLFCSTLQLLNHAKLNFLFGYTQTVSSLIFMQQSYPRTACIRKGWVIRQLIKCLIFTGLMGFIIEQVIYSYICFSNYRLISNCNAILPEYFCSILTQLSRIRNTRWKGTCWMLWRESWNYQYQLYMCGFACSIAFSICGKWQVILWYVVFHGNSMHFICLL